MAGKDKDTTEATAPVETTTPAADTSEEEFAAAFDEFAAVDDTVSQAATETPPDNGRDDKAAADDGQKPAGEPAASAETADQATSGDDPPDGATETTTDAAASDDAAETTDIWANATPEQRAAHEAALHENTSNRTRASAQNRKITQLLAGQKPAASPAADPASEPETDEEWEAFEKEYPEVAGPVRKRMATIEAENAQLRGRVTGIADDRAQDAIDTEEALLTQRHPDWEQVTSSDEFSAWLPEQPRYVQEGFARNGSAIVDGQEAASLIDLFKGVDAAPETEPSKGGEQPAKDAGNNGMDSRRKRRLESAVTSESGSAGPGAGPPEGDFDAAFDHFAAQS